MARKRYKPEEIVNMLRLVAHHATLQNEAAVTVDAMELEHGLGDIDAERLDSHGLLLDSFRPSG